MLSQDGNLPSHALKVDTDDLVSSQYLLESFNWIYDIGVILLLKGIFVLKVDSVQGVKKWGTTF